VASVIVAILQCTFELLFKPFWWRWSSQCTCNRW